ncbi:hypothetical protein E1A91_D07G066700v1 [Gossypium mustelinum]|uniref:Tetraspanin-8-like n=1 Tax=Gossypium mustelinum TaxID=34275 RepID=A0A5D2U4K7_GOSMU|nr:hypothetical protein E1A91_D07G066700v1 [Gossypium mustelinum]
MVRISNAIFNCINFIPLVLGLIAVVVSIYFSRNDSTVCETSARNPLLIIGIISVFVAVLALIGSCTKNGSIFLTIYSVLLILIILALFCLTFFALIVSNKELAKRIAGKGVGSVRLKDYSRWLKKNYLDAQHWEKVRSCLSESNICSSLHSEKAIFKLGFIKQKFSMIQSGCCKPPMYCKYEKKNATFWEMPKSGPDVPDIDCLTWSNDKEKLCYDCKSCKGGFLVDIKKQWRFMAIVNLVILVLILIIFNIGCSVRRRKEPKSDFAPKYLPPQILPDYIPPPQTMV